MKLSFFISLLFLCSSLQAKPLLIYNTHLELKCDCKIKVTDENNKTKMVDLGFPESSKCKFIKHAETNLVHLERVTNTYIFLVESTLTHNDKCLSKYTAIAIKNNGDVITTDTKKTSGTCHIDRERKVFEYFFHKMDIRN